MDSAPPQPVSSSRALWAWAGPFGLFAVLLGLTSLLHSKAPGAPWWLATPEFWVYPLQTVACLGMILYFRRDYPWAVSLPGALFGLGIGLLVFVLWISPQTFFHFAPRVEGGFDPTPLAASESPAVYHLTLALRFARLVVVVPLLEEIFWRGFLLRYLVKEDFLSLPFGACTRLSFGLVTLGFMLEHSPADYPAALATGALYNWVAVRTRSLTACVLAHALTNGLLGWYVMQTRQWGFW